LLPLIESASKNGQWLVLAGHDTQDSGNQTTYLTMLRELSEYVNDPAKMEYGLLRLEPSPNM
jgi:peptidoglycan-N-acetylglucosamine deacetylase